MIAQQAWLATKSFTLRLRASAVQNYFHINQTD